MSGRITREGDIELEDNIEIQMILASLLSYIRNNITITIHPGLKRTKSVLVHFVAKY